MKLAYIAGYQPIVLTFQTAEKKQLEQTLATSKSRAKWNPFDPPLTVSTVFQFIKEQEKQESQEKQAEHDKVLPFDRLLRKGLSTQIMQKMKYKKYKKSPLF